MQRRWERGNSALPPSQAIVKIIQFLYPMPLADGDGRNFDVKKCRHNLVNPAVAQRLLRQQK
ncbi:MAG: hypothetical protein FWB92_08200 [Oscillospiraceae bacterium]|nr:hypothetical protein [Oscillospiraceae bacterium]